MSRLVNMATLGKALERAEHYAWVLVGLLVLLLGGCWVYRAAHARSDTLGVQLAVKQDSLNTALQVRDSVAEQLAHLEKYADVQHAIAVRAGERADSLTRVAERYRTFRLRIIDSMHVGVTASDSEHTEEVHEVPIEITEQLELDSAALHAQDDRAVKQTAELAVRLTEIGAFKKTVQLDSVAMRQLEGQVADLRAVKTPRFTFTQGVTVGLVVAAIVKLAAFFAR